MIYFSYSNSKFKEQIEYVLNTLSSFMFYKTDVLIGHYRLFMSEPIKKNDLFVFYGEKKFKSDHKNQIYIKQSRFWKSFLLANSMPQIPLRTYKSLPVLFGGNRVDFRRENDVKILYTDIDIIASSFFMLTGYEEIINKNRDIFDRFPAKEAIAFKEKFLDKPIVNQYIELFWNWISNFNINIKRKDFWEGKDFALVLTHDVDKIKRYPKYIPPMLSLKRTIKNNNFREGIYFINDYIKTLLKLKKDEYDNFDIIMNLEEKVGVKSSFYFLADNRINKYATDYSLIEIKEKGIFKNMKNKGFEVGFHAGFYTYKNKKLFIKEKNKLERLSKNHIYGVRHHYLRYDILKTMDIWEEAGLLYDSTLGFSQKTGFRRGICYPFKPFDVLKNQEKNIYEVPLMVMDTTLFSSEKLNLLTAEEKVVNMMKEIARYKGILVILFHNSSFSEIYFPERFSLYNKILDIMSNSNVLAGSAIQIIKIWEKNILL